MSAVGVFQDAQQGLLLFGSGGVGVSAGDGGDKGSGAAKSPNDKFRGKK